MIKWIKGIINDIKVGRRLKHIQNALKRGAISEEEREKIRGELEEMRPIILNGLRTLHPEIKRVLLETGVKEEIERILAGA